LSDRILQVSRAGPWLARAALVLFAAVACGAYGGILSDQVLGYVQQKYGRSAAGILEDWQEMIEENRNNGEEEKLDVVNRFFNRRIRFVSDQRHWRKPDYWATPIETMATRGGDCEDFAVAKYFTLLEMGVPDEKMRLTYVKATRPRQAHMVLSYYPTPGAEPLVLDNLTSRIKPASARRDLTPVYSFNGSSLWMSKERGGGGVLTGSADNVRLWRDLRTRFDNEKQR
jgi:predicted transglutaminase-like cysteine proteinase